MKSLPSSNYLKLFLLAQILLNMAIVHADVDFTSLNTTQGARVGSGALINTRIGASLQAIGDINGDSIGDFIVGLPNPAAQGQVAVIYGKKDGIPNIDNVNSLTSSQGFLITGTTVGDSFGYSIAGLDDINGDGIADYIIGAPGVSSGKGMAYVLFGKGSSSISSGSITTVLAATGGFKITSPSSTQSLGKSVSKAGDFNADGLNDILVGGPAYSSNAGRVFVIYGKRGSTRVDVVTSSMTASDGLNIQGDSSNNMVGYSVAPAGDYNKDGKADILIGAPGGRKVLLVFGTSVSKPSISTIGGGLSFQDGIEISVDYSSSITLGTALAGGGDVNGDGIKDFIIGAAQQETDSASAYVIFGGTDQSLYLLDSISGLESEYGFKITCTSGSIGLGYALSIQGDVNGDMIDDILISSPSSSGGGAVYAIYGDSQIGSFGDINVEKMTSSDGYKLYASSGDGDFGYAVNAAKDINGDGIADILVGNPQKSSNLGLAMVIYGTCSSGSTYDAASKTCKQASNVTTMTQFFNTLTYVGAVYGFLILLGLIFIFFMHRKNLRISGKLAQGASGNPAPIYSPVGQGGSPY